MSGEAASTSQLQTPEVGVRAVTIDCAARGQRRPIAVPGLQCREGINFGEIAQSMRAFLADCIFEIDELCAGLALEQLH